MRKKHKTRKKTDLLINRGIGSLGFVSRGHVYITSKSLFPIHKGIPSNWIFTPSLKPLPKLGGVSYIFRYPKIGANCLYFTMSRPLKHQHIVMHPSGAVPIEHDDEVFRLKSVMQLPSVAAWPWKSLSNTVPTTTLQEMRPPSNLLRQVGFTRKGNSLQDGIFWEIFHLRMGLS